MTSPMIKRINKMYKKTSQDYTHTFLICASTIFYLILIIAIVNH